MLWQSHARGILRAALPMMQVNEELMSMDCSTVERQQNEYHREIIQGYYQDLKTTKAKMKYRSDVVCPLKSSWNKASKRTNLW